jgi:hypothetical protein
VAEEPHIGQVDGKLSWRTRVVSASWLIGWIVMVAAGVLALILKEGNEVPAAVWVAMGVGLGLAAISGFAGDGTPGGSGLGGDGDDDVDGDGSGVF